MHALFYSVAVKKTIVIHSKQDLIDLANLIGREAHSNQVIGLSGPVGIGKSTFTRYLLEYYGFEYMGSPTFTVMHEYCNENNRILHIDLYTNSSTELLLEIMTLGDHLKVVEWIENANGKLEPDLLLTFSFEAEQRMVVIST